MAEAPKEKELKDQCFIYICQGYDLFVEERYQEALQLFDQAFQINPNDKQISNYRGVVLNRLGKYDEALAIFNKVLQLDPEFGYAYYNKGAALANLGQYEEALQHYDEALRLGFQVFEAHYEKGSILCKLERYAEAVKAYDEALRLDPKHAKAQKHREIALKENRKKDLSFYINQGIKDYNNQLYHVALIDYDQAAKIDPQNAYVHHQRAITFVAMDEYGKASKAYEKAIQLDPKNADIYCGKAELLKKRRLFREAIEAYNEASRLDPENADIHLEIGVLFERHYYYKEALQSYTESIRLNPQNPHTYEKRAILLRTLGRHEEALGDYEEILLLAPQFLEARKNREEILQYLNKRSILDQSKTLILSTQTDTNNGLPIGTSLGGIEVKIPQEQLSGGTFILGGQRSERIAVLTAIVRQLAEEDDPIFVFDSKGDLTDEIIKHLPDHCIQKTSLLDVTDSDYPLSLNVFSSVYAKNKDKRKTFAQFLVKWLSRFWSEIDEFIYVRTLLNHVVTTLAEKQKLSLANLPRFLLDLTFREEIVKGLYNKKTQDFWIYEYSQSDNKKSMEDLFLQRIRDLLDDNVLEECLCQQERCLDLPLAINQNEIVLVKLPVEESQFGEAAKLIGGLLMVLIQCLAASSKRGAVLVLDEFQHFCSDDFHQLFTQQDTHVKLILSQRKTDVTKKEQRSTLFSFRNIVSFRTVSDDAIDLTRRVFPGVERRGVKIYPDVLNWLPKHPHSYVSGFYDAYISKLKCAAEAEIRMVEEMEEINEGRIRLRGTGRYQEKLPRYYFNFGWKEVEFLPSQMRLILDKLRDFLYRVQESGIVYEEEKRELLFSWMRLVGGIRAIGKEEAQDSETKEKILQMRDELEKFRKEMDKKKCDIIVSYVVKHIAICNEYEKNKKEAEKKLAKLNNEIKEVKQKIAEQNAIMQYDVYELFDDIYVDRYQNFCRQYGQERDNKEYIEFLKDFSFGLEKQKKKREQLQRRWDAWEKLEELKKIFEEKRREIIYLCEDLDIKLDTHMHVFLGKSLKNIRDQKLYEIDKECEKQIETIDYQLDCKEMWAQSPIWVDIEVIDEDFEIGFNNMLAALIDEPLAEDNEDTIERHLMELPEDHAYVKTGITTSFMKLNPLPESISKEDFEKRKQDIITLSREKYARPRHEVEEEIAAVFQ